MKFVDDDIFDHLDFLFFVEYYQNLLVDDDDGDDDDDVDYDHSNYVFFFV
jgi:hypothetical protein